MILAGVSGTGKSKLGELVAEFYSANRTSNAIAEGTPAPGSSFVFVPARGEHNPDRFALIAVRPDWIDNPVESLDSSIRLPNQYESTQALDLVLRAHKALTDATDKSGRAKVFHAAG